MKNTLTALTLKNQDVKAATAFYDRIGDISDLLCESGLTDSRGQIIISMMIVRRLECDLQNTKKVMLGVVRKEPDLPADRLFRAAGCSFYNLSDYSLETISRLGGDAARGFISYVDAFSSNVKDVLAALNLDETVIRMDEAGCLCETLGIISEFDISPDRLDSPGFEAMLELITRIFETDCRA